MRVSPEQARAQVSTTLQRRVVDHLATRPGWSTTDRLMSELFPQCVRPDGINRMQRDETKRRLTSALRRLQHVGYVRYDDGGWMR